MKLLPGCGSFPTHHRAVFLNTLAQAPAAAHGLTKTLCRRPALGRADLGGFKPTPSHSPPPRGRASLLERRGDPAGAAGTGAGGRKEKAQGGRREGGRPSRPGEVGAFPSEVGNLKRELKMRREARRPRHLPSSPSSRQHPSPPPVATRGPPGGCRRLTGRAVQGRGAGRGGGRRRLRLLVGGGGGRGGAGGGQHEVAVGRRQAAQAHRVQAGQQLGPPALDGLPAHAASVQQVERGRLPAALRRALAALGLVLPAQRRRPAAIRRAG